MIKEIYDDDGRLIRIYNEYARLFRDYTYGSLPLVTKRATHSYGNMLLQEYFTYPKPSNGYMTG